MTVLWFDVLSTSIALYWIAGSCITSRYWAKGLSCILLCLFFKNCKHIVLAVFNWLVQLYLCNSCGCWWWCYCLLSFRFEACWPALQRDTHGIIFVYNPSSGDHARDLELLYNYFVTQTGFSYKNCVVFANQKQPADKDVKHSSKLCMLSFILLSFAKINNYLVQLFILSIIYMTYSIQFLCILTHQLGVPCTVWFAVGTCLCGVPCTAGEWLVILYASIP
jgi:hypothetical protein